MLGRADISEGGMAFLTCRQHSGYQYWPRVRRGALRSPVLPNVPTVAESGLPGYDTGLWWGLVAPSGLPAAVKAKLEKDVADAVQAPAVQQRLLGLGAAPIGSTSEEFAALIRAEYDKWGPVIKAAGIRGE
jgi:tripartite-type tricarboxylate transporter receptor subunit TctC